MVLAADLKRPLIVRLIAEMETGRYFSAKILIQIGLPVGMTIMQQEEQELLADVISEPDVFNAIGLQEAQIVREETRDGTLSLPRIRCI
jgi:hypothetical protein